MQLFYDLDGVLANFDKGIGEVLDTDNIYKYDFVYGPDVFWETINKRAPNIFAEFEPMPGAYALWEATKHLRPSVLTALPKTNRENVDRQKREWVAYHFGVHVPVITCSTIDKPMFCKPGDILIDDRAVNRQAWFNKEGQFILHRSAVETWVELRSMNVI